MADVANSQHGNQGNQEHKYREANVDRIHADLLSLEQLEKREWERGGTFVNEFCEPATRWREHVCGKCEQPGT